ncbi:DUF4352 domain-containing protein [Candidatus Micrarchaeota archaeon]|nr:DUF4352 domain-containing protein [Candidatus Micrarchaeota archaeon]
MRMMLLLFIAGILLLGFGCPSEENGETVPEGETPEEEGEGPGEEIEPQGENQTGEGPGITHCSDGTPVGECSENQPRICDTYGNLVEDADTCGCPENSVKKGKTCIFNCDDGTRIGECSEEKPYYCNSNAALEERADLCGCPEGYDVYNTTCRNSCEDGTLMGECSEENPPLYCNEEYEMVMNPPLCGCHPWELLRDGKCFDPTSVEYSMNEEIPVEENITMILEDADEMNCDDGLYMRVRLTVENRGAEDIEITPYNFKVFCDERRTGINRPEGCTVADLFRWDDIDAGETETGFVWFKVTGGAGDYHAEYLHKYTPSVLKEFYIAMDEED